MSIKTLEQSNLKLEIPSLILTSNLKELARRYFADATFRKQLQLNLQETLAKNGISLSQNEFETVKMYLATDVMAVSSADVSPFIFPWDAWQS